MNAFYNIPKFLQWLVAIVLALVVFLAFGIYFKLLTVNFLLGILFLLCLMPLFQFCSTPFFTLLGTYHYLSPMLLVYNPRSKKYDLHNGTSFDYLMVMRKYRAGIEARTVILKYYLEGLLEIVRRVENGELPKDVSVQGVSYFFSESTAQRLGFQVIKDDSYLTFNLYLNYFDLLWMYSYSKGKLAFPNLKNIKKVIATGEDLVNNKPQLLRIERYLNKRMETLS